MDYVEAPVRRYLSQGTRARGELKAQDGFTSKTITRTPVSFPREGVTVFGHFKGLGDKHIRLRKCSTCKPVREIFIGNC